MAVRQETGFPAPHGGEAVRAYRRRPLTRRVGLETLAGLVIDQAIADKTHFPVVFPKDTSGNEVTTTSRKIGSVFGTFTGPAFVDPVLRDVFVAQPDPGMQESPAQNTFVRILMIAGTSRIGRAIGTHFWETVTHPVSALSDFFKSK